MYIRRRVPTSSFPKSSMLPITGGSTAPSGPGPWVPGTAVRRRFAAPFFTSIDSQVLSARVRVKPTFSR